MRFTRNFPINHLLFFSFLYYSLEGALYTLRKPGVSGGNPSRELSIYWHYNIIIIYN